MNRGRASRQIFAGKKKNTRNRDRAHVKSRDNKHLRSVRGLTSSVNLMKFSLSLSLSLSFFLSRDIFHRTPRDERLRTDVAPRAICKPNDGKLKAARPITDVSCRIAQSLIRSSLLRR